MTDSPSDGVSRDPATGKTVLPMAPKARPPTRWLRRVGPIPAAYLVAVVLVAVVHPFLPSWRWLLVHLLLLGGATNAIVVWSNHFAVAVLRSSPPRSRRWEATRLITLNAGVVAVLVGGVVGRTDDGWWSWVAVAGAGLVFVAVLGHLLTLASRLRRALPAPFTVSVYYYVAAAVALLVGIPVGAWMLLDGGNARLHLFHAHVNVLGWVTLTILGALLTLWPAIVHTRMAEGTARASARALPAALTGLTLLGVGLLAWWRPVAVVGLGLFGAAVVVSAVPHVVAARRKAPSSFAAWSVAAALGWLTIALVVDAATLLTSPDPGLAVGRFGSVLAPLLVGFVAQTLIGALTYLLPMARGGGPAMRRARTSILERHGPQRVVMANLALAVFVLPVGPYVRITTSMLVLAALGQFLIAAGRALHLDRRS